MDDRERTTDLANRSLRAKRLRDIALMLPLAGVFLYLSPIPRIFSVDASVLGIPVIFLFIYGVWLGLIVLSARLAKKLSQDQE